MLVLAVGCSSNEAPDFATQNNEAPKHEAAGKKAQAAPERGGVRNASLEIGPAVNTKKPLFTRNIKLQVRSTGFNLNDAQVEWLLNGVPVGTSDPVDIFDPTESSAVKGDTVQAKAVLDGDEILSNIVTIQNAKPEITNVNYVVPDALEAKSHLSVDVTTKDEDDDPVTLEYQWQKNGEPAGEGPSIDMDLKRGDEFSITITPYDGEEYGRPASLKRTVGNFPPKVAQQYSFTYENGVYSYQMQAVDPDGDTLTYVLKSGPEGMVVNSTTGLVTWKAPDSFQGTAPFVVAVQDGNGGETQMEMTLISEKRTGATSAQ